MTFLAALQRLDNEVLKNAAYKVRRHPVIVVDETRRRKRIPNYLPVRDGIFIYRKMTAAEKMKFLNYLDELYYLNWIVELR